MDKKPTTFGLTPAKLADILSVCSDTSEAGNEIDPEQEKAELLHDLLAETLPFELPKKKLPKGVLYHLTQIPGVIIGEPIRNLLNNPQTNIVLLKKVKDYSKKLSQCADSEAKHDTANVIYYAAIACALLFHDKKITKFSHEELRDSFSIFSKTQWVSPDLSELFDKASKYCQEKMKNMLKDQTNGQTIK